MEKLASTTNVILFLVISFSALISQARKRLPWDGLPNNADQLIFNSMAEALEIQEPVAAPRNLKIKDIECSEKDKKILCSGLVEGSGKEERKNIKNAEFFLKYLIAKDLSRPEKNSKGIQISRASFLECRYQLDQQPYYQCGNPPKLSKGRASAD